MPSDESTVASEAADVATALDKLFAPWSRTDAPGLVVGVARDGAPLYRRGFGMANLEAAAANTPATRMRIGSTSKHFTCLLALLLAEDGKLDIDAPIRAYLPELTGPGGEPTLRQLMQHRGGSRCYLDLGFIGHGFGLPPRGTALATQVRQTGRNFAPGAAMLYNNGGYHLLSIAIERVGGAPFEDQLKTRLFDPVGMAATNSIPSDHEITPGLAAMHMPLPGGRWRRGLFPSEEVRGEGAIVSTVDDMLRWMAHLRRRDRFGSPDTWAALTTPPTYADGSLGAYALGLMLHDYRGLPTVHHAGGVIGGSSQMLTLPEHGLDIIIIANGAPGANPVRLAEQVVDIVLADKVGAPTPPPAAEDFKALLGDWWAPEIGLMYSLVDEGGVLKLSIGRTPETMPLHGTEDGRLRAPALAIGEIEIAPEASADALAIHFGGEARQFRRLARDSADSKGFAGAAGRYYCPDADTTATLEAGDAGMSLRTADGHGSVETKLDVVDEALALPSAGSLMTLFGLSVQLLEEAGRVVGLRLNTARTRNLIFERVTDA